MLVIEPHFQLPGMDVDIDSLRWGFEEDHKRRVSADREELLVGALHRPGQHPAVHRTPVHKQILLTTVAPREFQTAQPSRGTHASGVLGERQGVARHVLAQHGRDTLRRCSRRVAQHLGALVDDAERNGGVRKGQPVDGIDDQGKLTGRGLQELPPGRSVEEQLAHGDDRAGGPADGLLSHDLAALHPQPAPAGAPAEALAISLTETASMLGRASPRKPNAWMASRSPAVAILLVAKRWTARRTSSGWIPDPSSPTRVSAAPAPSTSIRICVAWA